MNSSSTFRSRISSASRSRISSTTRFAALGAIAVLLAALAACGGSSDTTSPPPSIGGSAAPISSDRCDQNKAAGKITFLTGYNYQASASILEVLAADKLGYYQDLCLDVSIKPGTGDTSQNIKLLAADKTKISSIAEQDLITGVAGGAKITGISSYSDAALDILMTPTSVTDLKQLDGKKLGYKGFMPPAVQAMLVKAGVDYAGLKKITVGYDPTILPRGQVDALTGFISNEPLLLKAAGDDVTVWQPSKYGIPSSIGSFAVNPGFAQAHPDAVEDFLRATFHAYDYCADAAHVDQCISIQHGFAGAADDATHEKGVWTTEVQTIADNPLPGGFGTVDLDNVGKLASLISTYGGVKVVAATAKAEFDNTYVDAIMKDGQVIWPAP